MNINMSYAAVFSDSTHRLTFREPLHGPPDIQYDLVIVLVVLPNISTCKRKTNVIVTVSKYY